MLRFSAFLQRLSDACHERNHSLDTRAYLRAAGLSLGVLVMLVCGCGEGVAAARPNILFVLLDDLRWDALGAYGNQQVRTPNLDAFADQSLRFERFYVASPVCSPSRATFLTGLTIHEPGIEVGPGAAGFRLAPGVATVGRELSAAGYVTGFVGKAHLGGDPSAWGFGETPLVLPGRRFGDPGPASRRQIVVDGRVEWIDGHAPERLADAAIDFVERHRDEAWFLWLATTAPHHPYTPDPRNPVQAASLTPPPGWPPDTPFENRREWADYYSLIERLDRELGRVLQRLEAGGQAQRTLVWITSDNGVQLGSHGRRGKAVWYDASTRVPALVRWPGVTQAGAVADVPASSVDLFPTLSEIAGRPRREGRRGVSLVPVLRGAPIERTSVFSEVVRAGPHEAPRWQMVTDGRTKLLEIPNGSQTRLFDLVQDPGELRDVADAPAYGTRRRELEVALARWRSRPPPQGESGVSRSR